MDKSIGDSPIPEMVHQVPKLGPRIAPPVTAALAPCEQALHRTGEELLQTGSVPGDAIVVVVPAQLGV